MSTSLLFFNLTCIVCQLSLTSKYLLLSGFIASYNLPKYDLMIFGDNIKKRGRKEGKKGSENEIVSVKSPKAFSSERLLAIFYFICQEAVPPQSRIITQVLIDGNYC